MILEKEGDTLLILLTDSLYDINDRFIEELIFIISRISYKTHVYRIAFTRQFDQVTCSIFTMTDIRAVLQFWRENSELSFIRQVEKYSGGSVIEGRAFSLHTLAHYPPKMLRITQSLKRVVPYSQQTFLSQRRITTLGSYIKEHTYCFASIDESFDILQVNLASWQKFAHAIVKILHTLSLGPS